MPRGKGKVVMEVSRELRDRIRELAEKHGLLYEELLHKALDAYTQSKSEPHTQSNRPSVPVDCTARRARKGDKPLNVYYLECRDGAKAVVPKETLADLVSRFKFKIEVVE